MLIELLNIKLNIINIRKSESKKTCKEDQIWGLVRYQGEWKWR